jgi:hypothetical protein
MKDINYFEVIKGGTYEQKVVNSTDTDFDIGPQPSYYGQQPGTGCTISCRF